MAVVEKNILSALTLSVSLCAVKKITRETRGPGIGVGQNVIAEQMVLNALIQDSCLKMKLTTGLCRSRLQIHNVVAGVLCSQSFGTNPDQIIDTVCR